jgi:hypothetical protein
MQALSQPQNHLQICPSRPQLQSVQAVSDSSDIEISDSNTDASDPEDLMSSGSSDDVEASITSPGLLQSDPMDVDEDGEPEIDMGTESDVYVICILF